ncbi:MAG: CocE/NonD family hydrolase [Pseudomonadota bacterium]
MVLDAAPHHERTLQINPEDLPYAVADEEIYIPLADGTRMAARIWRPQTDGTFPAILEYIPYRKRDGTRTRDEEQHAYLAGHGYVSVRVDMRGSGDSDGVQLDEYLPIEQQDGLEVIAWLADQPWCTGSVGMFGLSWGGITTLQLASHRPPALKAIVPVGATDDRYYDDGCYFVGGLAGETVGWGGVMFALNGRPPDPVLFGDGWRDAWMRRLEEPDLFMKIWLEHQQRDDYWLQGSICTDYDRIQIPVYAISGWTDCWPNTVMRLMKNLNVPRKGLIGPWSHLFPDRALPGPGVNFLDEMLRWFDRWLKGDENGVETEPMLTLYRQQEVSTDPCHATRPGIWLDAQTWPDATVSQTTKWLGQDGLKEAPAEGTVSIRSPQSLGMLSGDYMPLTDDPTLAQMPGDQRTEDAESLCFDTDALTDPLDIIGTSTIDFEVSSDAGSGLVAVRLCDVDENGASTLITYGVVNLAQREGRELCADVAPGTKYRIRYDLNDIAHRVVAGHKLRVAVSNAMWPMAWPVADNHTLTLHLENCSVALPNADLKPSDPSRVVFTQPRVAVPGEVSVHQGSAHSRVISHDLASGAKALTLHEDFGRYQIHSADLTITGYGRDHFEIADADVHTAKADYQFRMGYARDGWNVATQGQMTVTCDQHSFYLRGELRAFEDDQEFFVRRWDEAIPRRGF